MKLYRNMGNDAGIVTEILYFQMNLNGQAFHVYSTCLNESLNSLKHNGKKIVFLSRKKYAELKMFCICVDAYKIYEGDDSDNLYEVLSTLKIENIKINNILVEKYKDMLENPHFEQKYYSRTADDVYKLGHDSIRLVKLLTYCGRSYYENPIY